MAIKSIRRFIGICGTMQIDGDGSTLALCGRCSRKRADEFASGFRGVRECGSASQRSDDGGLLNGMQRCAAVTVLGLSGYFFFADRAFFLLTADRHFVAARSCDGRVDRMKRAGRRDLFANKPSPTSLDLSWLR